MAIGAILEHKTVERAKKGIKQLISLTPEHGRRIKDGKEQIVPIKEVMKGDTLRVLPSEAVPVDGEILSGNTSIDISILLIFRQQRLERFVIAKTYQEDTGSENNKAPMQHIADKWATWLVPIALAIAVVT